MDRKNYAKKFFESKIISNYLHKFHASMHFIIIKKNAFIANSKTKLNNSKSILTILEFLHY